MSYQLLIYVLKGGPTSGNFGHAGREGKRGGSAPRTSVDFSLSADEFTRSLFNLISHNKITFTDAKNLQSEYNNRKKVNARKMPDINATMSEEEAAAMYDVDVTTRNYLGKLEDKWLRGADPEAKEDIVHMYNNFPQLKDMRLRQLHSQLAPDTNYDEFLNTPITGYRGGLPSYGNTFATFTLAKGAAESYAKQRGGLYKVTITPSELVGYAPTGASELFVPPYKGKVERIG